MFLQLYGEDEKVEVSLTFIDEDEKVIVFAMVIKQWELSICVDGLAINIKGYK